MSERDMTLLYMAARVDPNLRAATMRVGEELRALRESHAELLAALREFAEGPWHNSKCAGWSEDEGETEYDIRTVMRPELCDCAISRGRAAITKAEAINA